jgi:RimJ/RimL family protein N-acetyltransferase
METRALDLPHGPTILVRPLADGDTGTVASVFARLGAESRRRRFNGAKPCLSSRELAELARADATHHALVAWVAGDPHPAALAQLVRTSRDSAEIAFVVADEHQARGIGSALTRLLLDDARAAGIREITALASAENRAALALIRRTAAAVLEIRLEGAEQSIRAAIA